MKPKVVEEEKWIEIDGSVQQQWLLAVYFLTFDEERIHSNVTMISIMSLCNSVRGMQYVLDMNVNTKKPDNLAHLLTYKCYGIRPLVL